MRFFCYKCGIELETGTEVYEWHDDYYCPHCFDEVLDGIKEDAERVLESED